MLTRFVLALALALPALSWAQSNTTPRFRAPYTDRESTNQAFDKFDKAVGTEGASFLAYCANQANVGTTYLASVAAPAFMSPDPYARAAGDATCDARGSATEATADEIISSQVSVRVAGMCCAVETTPGATGVNTFTARSAVANLTDSLSCTIVAGGPVHCCVWAPRAAGPIIAAGATAAVQAVSTTNESAVGALCRLFLEPVH